MKNCLIEPYLSTPQAARKLGVSAPTLLRMAKAGEISHMRVGKRFRFRQTDINNYIRGARRNANP